MFILLIMIDNWSVQKINIIKLQTIKLCVQTTTYCVEVKNKIPTCVWSWVCVRKSDWVNEWVCVKEREWLSESVSE